MKIILSQFCKVDIDTVLYSKPIKWDELIKRALNGMIFLQQNTTHGWLFATKMNIKLQALFIQLSFNNNTMILIEFSCVRISEF
jgi:hypothetical protein